MRRVVVTGVGAVCSLGGNAREVTASLRECRSGIVFNPEMEALGFRCQVYAPARPFDTGALDKRTVQTLAPNAQYALVAGLEAVADAGLDSQVLQSDRTAIVVGSIMGGVNEATRVEQVLTERRNPSRAGGTGIVKIMNSGAAANLAAYLGTRGRSYSLSSACATGPDAIGHGTELVALGLHDVCVAGATDEDCWKQLGPSFDNWNGMPSAFNDRPAAACRPFDVHRAGLVIGAGAGMLVLEDLAHARARGASIYAEVAGYGSANDGSDMFQPSGQGARRAVRQALTSAAEVGVDHIDYINPHGAGTPIGDKVEAQWIREIFGAPSPLVSSSKSLAGHAMGAAGALEAIYTLLMMRHAFISPTVNLDEVDPECGGISHVRTAIEREVRTALTVNAGLGGTNGAIAFQKI